MGVLVDGVDVEVEEKREEEEEVMTVGGSMGEVEARVVR